MTDFLVKATQDE